MAKNKKSEEKEAVIETSIPDDRLKNLLLGLMDLVIFMGLWIVAAYFYGKQNYLVTFFVLTGMFYAAKWSIVYIARAVGDKPLFYLSEEGVGIPGVMKKDQVLSWQSVKKASILDRKNGGADILIESPEVKHPSHVQHFSMHYPFAKTQYEESRKAIVHGFRKHGISVAETEKKE